MFEVKVAFWRALCAIGDGLNESFLRHVDRNHEPPHRLWPRQEFALHNDSSTDPEPSSKNDRRTRPDATVGPQRKRIHLCVGELETTTDNPLDAHTQTLALLYN